jgi:deoxyribodipyrimidine photo-lyase
LQGKKHDPQGAYVRRWVPELTHVPDRFIHRPWKMPPEVQQKAGCIIEQDYLQTSGGDWRRFWMGNRWDGG